MCASWKSIKPPTRPERSPRRLIGARLLKYLLRFDRSQLREESAQSESVTRRPRSVVELRAGIREGPAEIERTGPTILSFRGIYEKNSLLTTVGN